MAGRIRKAMLLGMCAFAAFAAFAAVAGSARAVRKQVESSMLVTGTIDIAMDGSVDGFRLDKEDKLPPAVIRLARQALPEWRFDPVLVEGAPAPVRTSMSLRIVASRLPDKGYALVLRGASFGNDALDPEDRKVDGTTLQRDVVRPPMYPRSAVQSGISGTVYLLLRIGRDGKVEDAVGEQVNLTVVGSEAAMRTGRKTLETAALQAARRWTFKPPSVGEAADDPYWKARVPVSFSLDSQGAEEYGQWNAYVPGPRQSLPDWVDPQEVASSPDAVADGQLLQVGEGPRLLTPLG